MESVLEEIQAIFSSLWEYLTTVSSAEDPRKIVQMGMVTIDGIMYGSIHGLQEFLKSPEMKADLLARWDGAFSLFGVDEAYDSV